jgi:hypothetical protein
MEETRLTYMLLLISKSGFLPGRQVAKSPDPEGKMVMVSEFERIKCKFIR